MRKKSLTIPIVVMILVFMLTTVSVQAYVTEVSDPGKANKILSDFHTPVIRPSESGRLSFNITNEYEGDFENVRFTVDIYGYADLDEEKDISEIDSPPVFKGSGTTTRSFDLGMRASGSTIPVELIIQTERKTEKGVYFVRFEIEFDYGPTGNHSVLRSRGHFTDEEWSFATRRPSEGDPNYSGSINITHLEVNGIIPDTSFSVKTSIPRWPQYLLGGLAAFFGIFAVMLYMQEEYNSFPWLEKTLNQWSGKFKQFRRRFERGPRKS